MPSVSSLGVGSGLDLSSLLTQLVEAERAPTTQRLDLKEAQAQASISAFGSLKSSLADFQTILKDLTDLTEFQDRSTTTSNPEIFTVTADSTASVGSTDINVLNLASAHKLTTGSFAAPDAVIGTGSLTIDAGGSSFNINITDGSVNAIKDAINNSAAAEKMTASIITVDDTDNPGSSVTKLVLNAKDAGANNAIEISVIDDDDDNDYTTGLSQLLFKPSDPNNQLTQLDEAVDAKITVDGFAVSSETNEFKDAIEGVTITALKASEDPENEPPETLAIALNTTAIKGKLASFTTAFNGLKDTLNQLSDYNAETGQAGLLSGDATVRVTEEQIERLLYSFSDGNGAVNSLSQLGITTGEKGRLSLDDTVLDKVVASNFNDIGEFFAGDDGLATQLDDLVTGFLSATGIVETRENGFDTALQEIAGDRIALDQRLATIEARTRQKFAGMDSLIATLNSTGSFLTEQLKNTSAIITGIKNT